MLIVTILIITNTVKLAKGRVVVVKALWLYASIETDEADPKLDPFGCDSITQPRKLTQKEAVYPFPPNKSTYTAIRQ